MFYTYVLFSLKDRKLYIGSTSDWEKRLERHNNGEVISTRYRRPLKLILYEALPTSAEAKSREVYLKSGAGRKNLYQMLKVTLKELGYEFLK
ncbi:hypothetical protein A3A60_00240 [Candidatus Curtissbacteria bacterium RIFCSPLOWO2_01_FULL_42_26]|uniref:GIY-YIG domain-containing protein n=1 Tax=Candidatus Curtissbacteria bacterium RIFCSPLOWO2_01_FULL_42_26 TaxID=1797729 RepID=A0A1F5I348_9BACT|nr:MAG: hypothetical protein A3A60_00240 [Candidatus Curtissbacteria bacterium RIFCSPLOWO2_01_FULL_42_26]